VRRPREFLEALRLAAERAKPVVALKLARNPRTRQMAMSHTAALAGDAWVYDVALRQAGAAVAGDPEELMDRLAMFEQIDEGRRDRCASPMLPSGRRGSHANAGENDWAARSVPVPARGARRATLELTVAWSSLNYFPSAEASMNDLRIA
jgi:hypothetical protein